MASFAWTTEIIFVIASRISVSIGSRGGIGMARSVGLRDVGEGGRDVGIGGNDKNFAGYVGTQSPVGVPIGVITESQPKP